MVFYNEKTICFLWSKDYYLYGFQASARKYTFYLLLIIFNR